METAGNQERVQAKAEVVPVGDFPIEPKGKDRNGGIVVTTFDDKVLYFRPKEIKFLQAIIEMGGDLRRAGEMVGVNREWILKFLRRPSVKRWLKDRLKEASVRNGVTVDWWVSQLKDVVDGKKDFSTAQSNAMSMLGKHIGAIDTGGGSLIGKLPGGRFELGFVLKKND